MTEERPRFLTVFVFLLTINAIITGIHYLLIYLGVIPIKGSITTVTEFAMADVIVTIVPSVIGAYGLWRLKAWGLALAIISSGGYLHGMIALLTRSAIEAQYSFMSFVSVYFVLFSVLLIFYLWQQRRLFT